MSATLDQQLIDLKLSELLEKFGAGEATPGAGSGAALMGLLACNLCTTVIKKTQGRRDYSAVRLQLGMMGPRLEVLEDKLRDDFQRDSDKWEVVVEVRLKRNQKEKGSEEYKRLDDRQRSLTEDATEVLLEISASCLEVSENALNLFQAAYQAVRGDSSVAVWAALAGAKSAVATAYLNLKSFNDQERASRVRDECDRLLERADSLQSDLDSKVAALRREGLPTTAVLPKPAEAAREDLPLAARTTRAARAEEPPLQKSRTVTNERGHAPSDKEVFAKVFKGKRWEAWFTKIHDFFTRHALGPFADNEDFLGYIKQRISEARHRSPEKLTPGALLDWYKDFKVRERNEGPRL